MLLKLKLSWCGVQNMKYGYARVSTESQSLSTQLQLLKQVGIDEIFQEKYTRTTTKRPEFARLLAIVQPNDVIIVTKLDRFARNTGEDLQMIQQLFENQVKLMKQPVCRNGKQLATVGMQEKIWETWK